MITLKDMQDMQRALKAKHEGEWAPLTPDYGRSCLLWAVEEFGEIVSVIKKRGEDAIMADPAVRAAFVEEFVDVFMFLNDALICFDVSPDEFSNAYEKKHARNMNRNWHEESKISSPEWSAN